MVDGTFHSLGSEVATEESESTPATLFRNAAQVLIQSELDAAEDQRLRRQRRQQQVRNEYEGEVLGGLRGGITIFKDNLEYHRDRRDVNQEQKETWTALTEARNDHVLNVTNTMAEIQHLQVQAPLDKHRREVYQEEATFEDNRTHLVSREAQAHEKVMTELIGAQASDLKKLELDALMEQRKLDSDDKDKDRASAELIEMMDISKRLPDILSELRWMEKEQPDEQIKAAAKVVESALLAFSSMGVTMDKDDRETIAPILRDALKEGMKGIRRGNK